MSDSPKMTIELFREFEKQVLRILVIPHLGAEAVKSIENEAELVSYEHSGCGYFLTVRHRNVSRTRVVCGKPIVAGRVDNANCGFMAAMSQNWLPDSAVILSLFLRAAGRTRAPARARSDEPGRLETACRSCGRLT
jgi:hypothetical protein